MDNVVIVEGNLTRDPKTQTTSTGQTATSFGIAVDRLVNKDAPKIEDRTKTSFFEVVVWNGVGQNVQASLVKGQRVIVSGLLFLEDWTDKNDQPRTTAKIRADLVGPSLRWATAVVTKNPRPGGSDLGPEPTPRAAAPATSAPDEEPF